MSATAAGCSSISLSMKYGWPPFSAAARSQSTRNGLTSAGSPAKSVTV